MLPRVLLTAALCLTQAATAVALPLLATQQKLPDTGWGPGLPGAGGLVVPSSDGRFLYVPSGHPAHVLVVLGRDLTSGDLTLVQTLSDATLQGNMHAALSPDEAHLYVASRFPSDAVTVYARDASTGVLSFVEAERDELGGATGLNDVQYLAPSPDGAHVYAAAEDDDAVTVFARDAGTGELTVVQTLVDGVGGAAGLAGARAVLVSPDGAHVYVASDPTGPGDAIGVFSRDAGTGELSFVEEVPAPDGTRGLAMSGDGAHLYVASEISDALSVFARDAGSGALTLVDLEQQGVAGVSGLDGVGLVVVSPDGASVYASSGPLAHRTVGELAVFARDPVSGALTFLQSVTEGAAAGTKGLGIAADGSLLFTRSQLRNGVAVWSRDLATGALDLVRWEPALAGTGLPAMSPDGAHLYTPSSASLGGISWFARDPATGDLSVGGAVFDGVLGVDGIDRASDVVVSPDGAHVYVTSPTESAVAVFGRDPGSGALSFLTAVRDGVDGVAGLAGARSMTLDGAGTHLYVASDVAEAIAVFSRDPGSGELAFVEAEQDGVGGLTGLRDPLRPVLSPDEAQLYVPTGQDTVVVFERDPGTGALSFVESHTDGVGGVLGLVGLGALVLSPDGAHVYVGIDTGKPSDLAYLFTRDAATGRLTPVGKTSDQAAAVDAFSEGSRTLAIRADGLRLYAGSNAGLAELLRDPTTGALTYRQRNRDTTAVTFGPGDGRLYGAGPTVLVAEQLCPVTPTGGCRDAGRVILKVVDRANDSADTLGFRWLLGGATELAALGDPIDGTTDYALCLYEDGPGGPNLFFDSHLTRAATCGATPCWRRLGPASAPRGLQYRKFLGAPDGIGSLKLFAGEEGRAKLILAGRGPRLRLAGPPYASPVTAQLVHREGECWGTTFSGADILENGPRSPTVAQFRALRRTP